MRGGYLRVVLAAAIAAISGACPHGKMKSPDRAGAAVARKENRLALTREQISERAIATLSGAEKNSSVVYLEPSLVKCGNAVEIDRKQVRPRWDAYLVFIDLQPQSNWGHPCRYLLISLETGEIETLDASFPPFLKGPSRPLRVIWKGPQVPDWAVAGH